MYAIIQTGGKQYKVAPGDIIQIEKLIGDVGSAVNFDQVLFYSKPGDGDSQVLLGKPLLAGASVQAEIVGQGRGEKIRTVKRVLHNRYRRELGHRQPLTQVIVTGVDNGAGEKAELTENEKKLKLASFTSHLKPKGLSSTPKTLGSRKRMAQAARAAAKAPASEAGATPAKKAKKAPKK